MWVKVGLATPNLVELGPGLKSRYERVHDRSSRRSRDHHQRYQTAITLYTLVMATLMITGGKLGTILGRRRAFRLGLILYAAGSLTTPLAPNLTVLLIGWSLLEGLGASVIMPAIVALVAANFVPERRAGTFALVAAAGAMANVLPERAARTMSPTRLQQIETRAINSVDRDTHPAALDNPCHAGPRRQCGDVFAAQFTHCE